MGASPPPLAPLEVAVGRGCAALAGLQDVGVHTEAHGAAGDAPVKAGIAKYLVETLGLGLRLDLLRSRHHHRGDARGDLLAGDDLGGSTQVADARVGAGADEHSVDGDLLDRGTRL